MNMVFFGGFGLQASKVQRHLACAYAHRGSANVQHHDAEKPNDAQQGAGSIEGHVGPGV